MRIHILHILVSVTLLLAVAAAPHQARAKAANTLWPLECPACPAQPQCPEPPECEVCQPTPCPPTPCPPPPPPVTIIEKKHVVVPLATKRTLGNAAAPDVLKGKTFSNAGQIGISGTRPPLTIAKSGQTQCFDTGGQEIECAGTGQDGETQRGLATGQRFTGNSDGTVTDNLTGLIWLRDGNCTEFYPGDATGQNTRLWQEALDSAALLSSGYCGLSDGSAAGDWRIPNVKELLSLIDHDQYAPALPPGHPFTNIITDYYTEYASSTSWAYDGNRTRAWSMYFLIGWVDWAHKATMKLGVLPVRGENL